ncbi:MAG: EFR1 family ferrodoxin [Endomicrobium sp.]|jgi:ferredoxin|nr:EFR1 family ferrodoxin [Endomicrobium sp.]
MNNTTVDIYFFTGTGNTFLAASKIAKTLENSNCTVNIFDIAKTDVKSIDLSHTIGIGFPIACWNTFPIVKIFINNLPIVGGTTEVFIFTTMGDSSLNAASNFGYVLKNKGYKIIGTHGFLMPNNFIAVRKETKNIKKREKAYKEMDVFTKSLIEENTEPIKTSLLFKLCFAITNFITDRWKGKLFQKIVKFKVKKNICNKCNLCINICPTKNIGLDKNNYPVFKAQNCQICMRCISYCPQKAIKSFLIKKTYQALNQQELNKCFF